jgi:hypothetical protein
MPHTCANLFGISCTNLRFKNNIRYSVIDPMNDYRVQLPGSIGGPSIRWSKVFI